MSRDAISTNRKHAFRDEVNKPALSLATELLRIESTFQWCIYCVWYCWAFV